MKLKLYVLTLALGVATPGLSHHSLSGQFDVAKSFRIEGVVSRVDWMNPHVYVHVDVQQGEEKITYKLESLPVAMMRKAGLNKQLLQGEGKSVVIDAYPARNGTKTLGYMLYLKFADGREVRFTKVPGAEQA